MKLRKLLQKESSFYLIIFFANLVIFGLFIPYLGFYWDDLPYLWYRHIGGVWGVTKSLAMDRPALGIFYILPMALIGDHPFGWQIYAILARFILIISVYYFLFNLWPDQKIRNKMAAVLFMVYPGFTQQWISAIYSHAFIIFALYFFGLSIFIKSIRRDSRSIPLILLSLLIPAFCLASTEYLVGLEMIRPLIIYKLIKERNGKQPFLQLLKTVIINYLPYLILLVSFIVYRIFLVSSVLYKVQNVDGFIHSPGQTLWTLVSQQFENINAAFIKSWSQIFKAFGLISADSIVRKVYLAILAIMFLFSLFFLHSWISFDSESEEILNKKWVKEAFWGSMLIMFTAGMPFWAANLEPGTSFPYDRLLLPYMLPASILIIVLLSFFREKMKTYCFLFALFFGFSASFHVFKADIYRNEWDDFKQFFTQIAERIPSIDEDTIFITDELPLTFYSDYSLSAVLNWLYAADVSQGQMPYLINYTKARLGSSLPSLNADTKITQKYRIVQFSGSTNRMIIFYHQPPGCVHLCDPDLDPFNPLLSHDLKAAAALSNLDLIRPERVQNQLFLMSMDTQESWCAYYQKASLALQMKDYQKVADLADTAFSLGDHPNDASERFPFIEGYALTEQWKKAIQLTDATHDISTLYDPMICELWRRIDHNTDNSREKANSLAHIMNQYGCDFNQE